MARKRHIGRKVAALGAVGAAGIAAGVYHKQLASKAAGLYSRAKSVGGAKGQALATRARKIHSALRERGAKVLVSRKK